MGLVLGTAPNSVSKYHDKLKWDGFDSVRAITLLQREDFQRYDVPLGHCAQLVHHAKETSGLKQRNSVCAPCCCFVGLGYVSCGQWYWGLLTMDLQWI